MLYVIEDCYEEWLSDEYVESWNCETCGNSNGTKDSFDENDVEDVVRVFEVDIRDLRLYMNLYNQTKKNRYLTLITYMYSDEYTLTRYRYTKKFQHKEEITLKFTEEQIKDIINIIKSWL